MRGSVWMKVESGMVDASQASRRDIMSNEDNYELPDNSRELLADLEVEFDTVAMALEALEAATDFKERTQQAEHLKRVIGRPRAMLGELSRMADRAGVQGKKIEDERFEKFTSLMS